MWESRSVGAAGSLASPEWKVWVRGLDGVSPVGQVFSLGQATVVVGFSWVTQYVGDFLPARDLPDWRF